MRRLLFGIASALLLAPAGCGHAPSMGPDREAFKTIDALYTAITLRDAGQLARNASELVQLQRDGRLPADAHGALAAIIGRAGAGEWEPARKQLRDFMLDQRGR